jgi:hypothetical protein
VYHPAQDLVTAVEFARHVYSLLTDSLRAHNDKLLEQGLREDDLRYQTPILCTPNTIGAELHPVAYKCSEPPAPEAPEITNVTRHDVHLKWTDPAFDGIAPTHYRISMRNLTRNYHMWSVIPYKTAITTQFFAVRNLPSGIKCQFRVEALNEGGFSSPSEPSPYVCPGETYAPIDFFTRWNRLAQGGPLAVIDRMKVCPLVREEYLQGLKLLVVFGQKDDGFHKGRIQISVAKACIYGLQVYTNDPDIVQAAIRALAYSLRGPNFQLVEDNITKEGTINLCAKYFNTFRNNTSIIMALGFLESCLSNDMVLTPIA